MSDTTSRPTSGDLDPSGTASSTRGALLIRDRVIRRTAERAVERAGVGALTPKVDLASAADGPIRLRVGIDLVYPHVPLAEVLGSLRRQVADELTRVIGRPVERIDIRVDALVQDPTVLPRVR